MLATEFAKAGADITQTFTFYSTDDWIDTFEENENGMKNTKATCREINQAACKIAREVADEFGTIVAGDITQTETYVETKDKAKVQAELRKALEVLIENDVDLIIVEYFFFIQASNIYYINARPIGTAINQNVVTNLVGDTKRG